MKLVKKLASLLLALVMALSLTVPVLATENDDSNNTNSNIADTGTITIKNAVGGNTYKVYKVFDAVGNGTNISYKLTNGKTTAPDGFSVDAAGNVTYTGEGTAAEGSTGIQLTADDIAAIAAYVTESDLKDTVTIAEGATTGTTNALEHGYYYITTTTGSAVTITSTNPNAEVTDKNEAPDLNKKITGVGDGSLDENGKNALAEVGTTVNYTVTIAVKNGAENYVFHDKLGTGLSYDESSLTVQVDDVVVSAEKYDTNTEQGDTITITFVNDWIKTQVGKTITITYSATVTSDALTADTGKNTATIDYGDNNSTTEYTTNVYNAKITVTKVDGSGQPLAGAGFVIAKSVTVPAESEGDESTTKTVYYQQTINNGTVSGISWVESIDDATELETVSGENGNVITFTGLADGTYTLIEKTVPAGYNKAADQSITINGGDYTTANLAQSVTVENKSGSELPTTGGMGTTIFYIVGAILVLGAGVLLVARRRMNSEK